MLDDAELLRLFADEKSETAFGEFVGRHVNFVYATALRYVGRDAHHAADVSQYVFTVAAREAGSLARHNALKAWLYTVARNASANVIRAERLRQIREREAQTMQEVSHPTPAENPDDLRTVLDQALGVLSERDQQAVFLRFFEGREYPEIGARFSVSADAARLRIERALEKMKTVLSRRGVASTTAALTGALMMEAAVMAPARLTGSLTGAAIAGATAKSGATVILSLMGRIKIGIASALAVAGLATVVVEARANRALHAEIESLQVTNVDTVRARNEERQLNAELQKLGAPNLDADELARLRTKEAQLRARPPGVDDALMMPAGLWQDVGRATPAAALETFLWSFSVGNMDIHLLHGVPKAVVFFGRRSTINRHRQLDFLKR